jgi:hypothetical protein
MFNVRIRLAAIATLLLLCCGASSQGGEGTAEDAMRKILSSHDKMAGFVKDSDYNGLKRMVALCSTELFRTEKPSGSSTRPMGKWLFPQDRAVIQLALGRLKTEKSRWGRELLAEYIAMATTHNSGDKKLAEAISAAVNPGYSTRSRFALRMALLFASEQGSAKWQRTWVQLMVGSLPVETYMSNARLYRELSLHDETVAEAIWESLSSRWKKAADGGKKAKEAFAYRVYFMSVRHPHARILDPFLRRMPALLRLSMKVYPHSDSFQFRAAVLNAVADSSSNEILDVKQREQYIKQMAVAEDDPRLKEQWEKLLKKIELAKNQKESKVKKNK